MAYIDQLLQTGQIPPVNSSQLQGYDVPDYPGPLSPYSQPPQPAMNPNGYINRTLQQMTAKRQENQGQNILLPLLQNLRERMQPNTYDVSQSILHSANPDYYKPASPNEMAQTRVSSELAPYTTMLDMNEKMAKAQHLSSTGTALNAGGGTGILMNRLRAENPSLTDAQALAMVNKSGIVTDSQGNAIAVPGYAEARGQIAGGEQTGKNISDLDYKPQIAGESSKASETAKAGVELGTAAEIARQKKIGSGEITDVQKHQIGQEQLAPSLSIMSSLYDNLEKAGAAVVPGANWKENLSASVRGGATGQYLGKKFGTTEQSIRNQINQQIPAIINDIRQVTGMSAKAMDSNAELKFYLAQLGDDDSDITARRAALASIQAKFLSGYKKQENPAAPPALPQGAATHKYNPATGQLEELK